jgi:hypothetical protein
MVNQNAPIERANDRWNQVYRISGAAALILGALFLIALISLVNASIGPGTAKGWFSPLQNNWLLALFQLNAGLNGVKFDLLSVLNPLDLAILALVATMYLGLYAALGKTSRILSIIAAIQPFLGIVLFVATKTAGRSGVMGAGLVISLVMLRSNIFGKVIALVGILASALLLIGDLSTTPDSHASITAMLIATGYVLLTVWFFLTARRLLELGQQ